MNELNELQQEEIGRQICEGCTSGILYEEDGTRVSWELTVNIFNDE